ncbi:MAG: helix-turn-helix domain-containing protein [Planctomycetaceae bacterium]
MSETIKRDERGRPISDDGYPLGGNATIAETAAASGLSGSKIYLMINRGELPAQRHGRSVRVPWQAVRERFFSNASPQ